MAKRINANTGYTSYCYTCSKCTGIACMPEIHYADFIRKHGSPPKDGDVQCIDCGGKASVDILPNSKLERPLVVVTGDNFTNSRQSFNHDNHNTYGYGWRRSHDFEDAVNKLIAFHDKSEV